MPSDLNERLLQHIEATTVPSRHYYIRWIAAVASLILVVGIGFKFLRLPKQTETKIVEAVEREEQPAKLPVVEPRQPVVAKAEEPVEQKDTTKVIEKDDVDKSQTKHVKLANLTREVDKVNVPRSKTTRVKPAEEPQPQTEAVVLASAADSLYYYLTQLENQMGDCRDSTCLAELTGLMRADERIKDLVNKIIHKQVETAYQEEYLVDTTTRYIPL